MKIKQKSGDYIFEGLNIFLMLFVVVVTLYPIWHVAMASISDPNSLSRHSGLLLLPYGVHFDAYRLVVQNPMIAIGYSNTLFYVFVGTAMNLLLTSLGAYVLSRRKFLFKNALMMFAVFTMFFSGGLIPTYLLVSQLGLVDSRFSLILPAAISTYNLIIMRTSFLAIPDSIEESAAIDGASDWVILFRIFFPLSKAIISVMILFYGVGHWNAWFNAMIYLRTRTLYPLQLILREVLIANDMNSMITGTVGDKVPIGEAVKYATIMVSTIPILCIYPVLQKYFIKGVMIGALKG